MSPRKPSGAVRTVLLNPRFLLLTLIGTLAGALIDIFAPLSGQMLALTAFLSAVLGLEASYMDQALRREKEQMDLLGSLRFPVELAPHSKLFDQFSKLAESMCKLSEYDDPYLIDYSVSRFAAMNEEAKALSTGQIVFRQTETWRTAYRDVLRGAHTKQYLSVAWVRSKDYWRDKPGESSMAFNYSLVKEGFAVQRIAVVADKLWPASQLLPDDAVTEWINEQHKHGIRMRLAREEELQAEPHLLSDFGIYGERAVGIQQLDEESHTVRFDLLFGRTHVDTYSDRWDRLALYARPYEELLEETGQHPVANGEEKGPQ